MRDIGLSTAYPEAACAALYSLPINLTTAMLLVNYASYAQMTPTPWPRAVWAHLSEETRGELHALDAILAHGTYLRDFILQHLPASAAAHEHWPAFQRWLADLAPSDLQELIDMGLTGGLAWYRAHMDVNDEVEGWLAAFDGQLPDAAHLTTMTEREAAARALLASWGTEPRDGALELILHPVQLQASLLRCLETLWEHGLRDEWHTTEAVLRRATMQACRHGDGAERPQSNAELVVRVTGLQADDEATSALRRASRIVFVPCVHLGRYLSVTAMLGTHYVMYEPTDGGALQAEVTPMARQVRDLETLGTGLVALGDPTRLAILMFLAEQGDEVYAQQIGETLAVHPSTVSRNLTQLERAGLVRVRRDGVQKVYELQRTSIQRLATMLTDTLG